MVKSGGKGKSPNPLFSISFQNFFKCSERSRHQTKRVGVHHSNQNLPTYIEEMLSVSLVGRCLKLVQKQRRLFRSYMLHKLLLHNHLLLLQMQQQVFKATKLINIKQIQLVVKMVICFSRLFSYIIVIPPAVLMYFFQVRYALLYLLVLNTQIVRTSPEK